MPVLNIQFGGQAKAADGSVVDLPPAFALAQRGPCLQVLLGVAQPIARQLLQQGKMLPQPVSGLALIDTGASTTCIDEDAAMKLGLPVTNVVTVASASHSAVQGNVYPAQIEVIGLPIAINALNSIGAPLAPQGLIALLGRDVLHHCAIFFNGPAGSISFAL